MDIFKIINPLGKSVPILISSPHSGTAFPPEIRSKFDAEMARKQDDADWFIDQLYDFAPQLGITMITANYSRWVIDLNRNPKSQPLYSDGRVITGLVPVTNFNGASLYNSEVPDTSEINVRIEKYYQPYHAEVRKMLDQMKSQFGKVLLFDAHSIRKIVPGIQPQPFPDLILGDNDGKSASESIINVAWNSISKSKYEVSHNHPFKGGQITRSFGRPEKNVHALQLEMAKINYMDVTETEYDVAKATEMRHLLQNMFVNLIAELQK